MVVPIESIVVGERRREDFGDIEGLAKSIEQYGLLHPIVIDDDNNLVAGERRLRAHRHLGLLSIEVTNIGMLSEAARREIELEENLRRKDLAAYERDRDLTRLVETAAEVLKEQQSKAVDLRTESVRKSTDGSSAPSDDKTRRGRPREAGSLRRISERIGVPVQTIQDAKKHVETAEAFPFMQEASWKQYHVLQAREQLDRIPEPDRPKVAALIDQPGIPPQAAIPILANLASAPSERREAILRLAESEDARDRGLALTEAAERPPMPDPRITPINNAIREVRQAITPFPDDPLASQLTDIVSRLKAVRTEVMQRSKERASSISREVA
jgi:ElaB/YqjD/DUF883 family membrane-anchored ribosome-binding protein